MVQFVHRLIRYLARRLPIGWLESAALTAINAKADSVAAAEGLRLLFRIDNRLYESQSRLALRYEGGVHPKHRLTRYHEFFVDRVAAGERVLDVGCGQGALAFALADRAGAFVTGVDLAAENIAKAQARYAHPRLDFQIGKAPEVLPAGPFDVVVLSNVLEHLPNRSAFLRQLIGATGAERILLRVPLIERDWRVPLKRELGVEWRTDPTHETEYVLKDFFAELTEAGLRVDDLRLAWGEAWTVTRKDGAKDGAKDGDT